MNPLDVQKITTDVNGFLSQNGKALREGEVLYYLAKKCPKEGAIVEIGSWQGKSTIWLGKGSVAGNQCPIFAIDPHTGSPEHQNGSPVWTFDLFKKNISKTNLEAIVHPIIKTSQLAAADFNRQIDLLFIDGAHEYESVKDDFECWFPRLKNGGIIAFHDSFLGWPGVNQVVKEKVYFSSCFKKICYINSITFAQKISRVTLRDQMNNRFAYGVRKLHEKSLQFPQPLKSIVKHAIWKPYFKNWLNELASECK